MQTQTEDSSVIISGLCANTQTDTNRQGQSSALRVRVMMMKHCVSRKGIGTESLQKWYFRNKRMSNGTNKLASRVSTEDSTLFILLDSVLALSLAELPC